MTPGSRRLVAGAPFDQGRRRSGLAATAWATTRGRGVRQLIQPEPAGFALAPNFVEAVQLAGSLGSRRRPVRAHGSSWPRSPTGRPMSGSQLRPGSPRQTRHRRRRSCRMGQRSSASGRLENVRCKLSGLMHGADGRDEGRGNHRRLPAYRDGRVRARPMHVRQRLAERRSARLLRGLGCPRGRRRFRPQLGGRSRIMRGQLERYTRAPGLGAWWVPPRPMTDGRLPSCTPTAPFGRGSSEESSASWRSSFPWIRTTSGSRRRGTATVRMR